MQMKKTFLLYSFIVFSHTCLFAQDEGEQAPATIDEMLPYTVDASELYLKDDLLFTTNFSIGHGKNKTIVSQNTISELSRFNVTGTLQGGYFIFDRFAAGLGVNIDVNYFNFDDGDEETYVDLFGGPFVRIYVVDKLYLQLLGGYGISNSKYESGSTVNNTNYNGLYAMGGLGYDIFLNSTKDIALEIGANYVYKKIVNTEDNTFEIQTGAMRYNVGFIFYFF